MAARPRASGAGRELAVGAAVVTGLMGVGTAGYALLEGMRLLDALYMTFITLTTIGFTEVGTLSDAGRVFTMVIATVGIGTFATLATRAVQIIVLNANFRSRRMQRRIDSLSGHYVICGFGRIGERVATDLREAGRDLVVIDRSDEPAEQLENQGFLFVQGNAEEEEILRAAGLERAAGLILVLPQDAANVFVALSAREIRPEAGPDGLFIVARTNEQSALNKLKRAGADKVISPLEIGADRIAQTILRPRVDRFMEKVLGVGALDFDLEEIRVSEGSLLDGRSLVEVDFRRRYNAIVVGVLKASGDWRFNPDATVPLDAGDTLIVLGSPARIGEIRAGGQMSLPGQSVK
ncbi:potassium channel family protein [Rubricoccus marinus]|nr:potassium channel protein [Rubricoccus marinus]